MIQYHLAITGKVQGVGFRYFVQMKAIEYNVNGWVRNKDNGSVEAVISGPKETLASFIDDIKKGNRFAAVHHVDITEQEPEHFRSFSIRY
ncbi:MULTISPECIES: acylphosphatase [unclassified Niallia]|uniref:acylphosphatase n=1 Tax=Niallia TaxID=2837506 RepID=UPI0017823953|nr:MULTISPECIES: acylphosphatase [unclassified Niallia]MBE0317731.1 acylphosphatase [Xanthomonas citri pv. punicae]MDL0435591.1 acylphosphatase [Niallia sp. SS-2023]UPO88102.1 acylphosphatase [Niallia sp. Man26]